MVWRRGRHVLSDWLYDWIAITRGLFPITQVIAVLPQRFPFINDSSSVRREVGVGSHTNMIPEIGNLFSPSPEPSDHFSLSAFQKERHENQQGPLLVAEEDLSALALLLPTAPRSWPPGRRRSPHATAATPAERPLVEIYLEFWVSFYSGGDRHKIVPSLVRTDTN